MSLSEPLDPIEARIIGVLIEKAFTTPEGYPLSINALVNGCNQKSNRFPVEFYTEQTVNEALLRLRLHRIVNEMHTAGARVVKYAHTAKEVLEVDDQELGILAELMLRGPQTHGELRGRIKRMAPVASLPELGVILGRLQARGLVEAVAPVAGSRAGRVGHCLGSGGGAGGGGAGLEPAGVGVEEPVAREVREAPVASVTVSAAPANPVIDELEERVRELEAEVASLKQRLDALEH